MGRLSYERTNTFEIDDRALAHLQAVIGTKLRRHESFTMTLGLGVAEGSGRVSFMINPASALAFRYRHSPARLNLAWIEALMDAANSPSGLEIIPEPSSEENA